MALSETILNFKALQQMDNARYIPPRRWRDRTPRRWRNGFLIWLALAAVVALIVLVLIWRTGCPPWGRVGA
jgi:hypothetical protein